MKIYREEAIHILSNLLMLKLSIEERKNILIDVFSTENEFENIDDFSSENLNESIINYLKNTFMGVTNLYLSRDLAKYSEGITWDIMGKNEKLEPCPCCSYKTLPNRGEYDICVLCKWEDDGNNEKDKHSSCNRGTINNYLENLINSNPLFFNSIKFERDL